MTGQDRGDARNEVVADDRWQRVLHREQRIDELLRAVTEILELPRNAGRTERRPRRSRTGCERRQGHGRISGSSRARDAASLRSQTV